MAAKLILADTSVLIDLFRKTDKSKAVLVQLLKEGYGYKISAITDYEIYVGASVTQIDFWNEFLRRVDVVPFDQHIARVAVGLSRDLKKKRKLIAIPDLFIAATAIAHDMPIATLNKRHFDIIDGLQIIG